MRQDERFRTLVEAADERQVKHMAEILEREEQHRCADAGARGAGEACGSQREDPGGPAHAGTRGTGGASGSQGFGVDRKRQADRQLQPDDYDGDGDCEIVIARAPEPPDGDRRKRARGTGEAFGSQREDPGGPAHTGTRGTGGASGSQGFCVDRKQQADHQFQPEDCDGDGDCEMWIARAAEPPDGDRRKLRGEDRFPYEAGEPARQRSQSSITHWFKRLAHRQQLSEPRASIGSSQTGTRILIRMVRGADWEAMIDV